MALDDDYLPIAVFREFEKRIVLAIGTSDRIMGMISEASREAINKADVAYSKRFDNLNEFNERMNQLSNTFMSKETWDVMHQALESRVRLLEQRTQEREGRYGIFNPLIMVLVAICGGLAGFVLESLLKK